MGLLDDAIREHLDLKRRRGADPAEIERAEREALGPVRRNRDPALAEDPELTGEEFDPALGSARDEPDGGTASDLAEEGYAPEGDDPDPDFGPAATGAGAYADEDDPFAEPVAREDDLFIRDEEPLHEDEDPHRTELMSTVDVPPVERAEDRPPVDRGADELPRGTGRGEEIVSPGEPTAEHDVAETFAEEDARAAAPPRATGAEDEDDMLEETPEFLQDTPDHDRLWFEQRPPRDFDFEG